MNVIIIIIIIIFIIIKNRKYSIKHISTNQIFSGLAIVFLNYHSHIFLFAKFSESSSQIYVHRLESLLQNKYITLT